ncbi:MULTISPECIES: OmpA family protein [Sulfurimonas]|uniref:OmpA family protein n=1 Tax=Sulfurimonas TaxID=202746 RepID=UPI0012648D68|nr:OmpA family protein [Sulfurimonas indica]
MKNVVQLFLMLVITTLLHASISQELEDNFYDDDFEEIIRFEMLHFTSENTLDEKSEKTLETAIEKIKELNESYKLKITLVGHIYRADDYYVGKIDNNLAYNSNINSSNDNQTKLYLDSVKNRLTESGVNEKTLSLYSKRGKVLGFSDEIQESGRLSDRVMLSVYVLKPEDIDSDRDGVYDRYDRCIGTPRGSKVDKNGCPVDSDHDGVLDYKDRCPDTPPEGVSVDAHGCPLDSDHDGVVDYKDKCENTPAGVNVDPHGCAVKQTLKLNFKTGSDKILKNSYAEVQRFAEFLKKNPGYKVKIIGHTDSIGKAVTNMALSIKRAQAVKAALVAEGIDASRIVATGRGELDPIESNRTKEGRKANRRIEIKLFN